MTLSLSSPRGSLSEPYRLAARCLTIRPSHPDCRPDCVYGLRLPLAENPFWDPMRATSSDQEAALGVGIPVGKVLAITWFLAGAMAAMAGVFLGIRDYSVDLNLGYIALRAFPAVIVGGLDSVMGAIVAGLLLGTLEVMTAGYINALLGPWGKNLHTVMPYLAMIIVLMIRPQGLFGSRKLSGCNANQSTQN